MAERPVHANRDDHQPYHGVTFLLRDGETWVPPADLLASLERAFPAVDLDQELARAAAWCAANPAKRKTTNGMPRFVNAWLGRSAGVHCRPGAPASIERDVTADELRQLLGCSP